jgi:hypothetical protein
MSGWLDAGIVLAGIAGMIALIVLGIVRVVGNGKAVAKRIAALEAFPLQGQFALVEARVAIAQRTFTTLPGLIERTQCAIASLAQTREQLQRSAAAAGEVGRVLKEMWKPKKR